MALWTPHNASHLGGLRSSKWRQAGHCLDGRHRRIEQVLGIAGLLERNEAFNTLAEFTDCSKCGLHGVSLMLHGVFPKQG